MGESLLNLPQEWTGHWWLPDAPEDRVPGVLHYDPEDGIELRLIGGWEYHVTSPGATGGIVIHQESRAWPVVLGEGDGQYITVLGAGLLKAQTFGLGKKSGRPQKLSLYASTILVGCHLTEPDDPEFISAEVTVENLTTWSRRSGLELTEWNKPNLTLGEIRLDRQFPVTADIGNGVEAKLSMVGWHPFRQDLRAENVARLREHASVSFDGKSPLKLNELTAFMKSVGDLLSLSTLSACAIISMRVWSPPTPERFPEDHPMRDFPHEVVVFQQLINKPNPAADSIEHRSLVLSLDDLSFGELMPRWFAQADRFEAARSMILGLRYVTGGYLETQVVTAVAAAESFHRSLALDPPLSPDEFRGIRTAALNAVATENRQWLSDRLASNEPTLKQRLIDLARRPGEFMADLVPNPEAWAKRAGQARNALAHVGLIERYSSDELYAIVQVTSAVVIVNLLHDLGVSTERLKLGLKEHSTLSQAARLASQFFPDVEGDCT